jgi:hypothetical protein
VIDEVSTTVAVVVAPVRAGLPHRKTDLQQLPSECVDGDRHMGIEAGMAGPAE